MLIDVAVRTRCQNETSSRPSVEQRDIFTQRKKEQLMMVKAVHVFPLEILSDGVVRVGVVKILKL